MQQFRTQSVSEERLILTQPEQYASRTVFYSEIDVALDPFPVSSGLANLDALWQGRPVLALVGRCLPGRTFSTVLESSGLENFVCHSPTEYSNLATELATHDDLFTALETIGKEVIQTLQTAPISHVKPLVESLERTYRSISSGL